MRQSLWRRAWRRLLVCTIEGGCFLDRERRDMCLYAILGERLCAPCMFLVVLADQGAEAVRMVVDSKTCAPAPVISFIRHISTVWTRSGHRRNQSWILRSRATPDRAFSEWRSVARVRIWE